jgi:hypothetical protein
MNKRLLPHLPRIFALWLLFLMAIVATGAFTLFVHEAGHARACIALGGNVGGFGHWLRDIFATLSTHCSIKPYPATVWAAGPLTSIVVWFISAIVITALLNRSAIKRGLCGSTLWGWWCWWNLTTLLREVLHAYASPSVWQDSTQFVHVMDINPNLVGIPLAAILVISLLLWFRIQYRLLPETLLSEWNRFLEAPSDWWHGTCPPQPQHAPSKTK